MEEIDIQQEYLKHEIISCFTRLSEEKQKELFDWYKGLTDKEREYVQLICEEAELDRDVLESECSDSW